jgi:uncharacterized membrane protein HdeD (DUF308 family)
VTVAILLTLAFIFVLIARGIANIVSWLRTPLELRGDWWKRFERQFRASIEPK